MEGKAVSPAINRDHLDAGHPAAGRATSMRLALDSARADRTTRRAAHYHAIAIAAALPTDGSTAALFDCSGAATRFLFSWPEQACPTTLLQLSTAPRSVRTVEVCGSAATTGFASTPMPHPVSGRSRCGSDGT